MCVTCVKTLEWLKLSASWTLSTPRQCQGCWISADSRAQLSLGKGKTLMTVSRNCTSYIVPCLKRLLTSRRRLMLTNQSAAGLPPPSHVLITSCAVVDKHLTLFIPGVDLVSSAIPSRCSALSRSVYDRGHMQCDSSPVILLQNAKQGLTWRCF